jgi:cobalamin biosynthesis protein CobT
MIKIILMSTENPKVMASLKKYLKSSALKDTVKDTFVSYLGKNSNESDFEAFMEYVESEYLTNECRKLDSAAAAKVGVYSLLDGMATTSKGRPPSLNSLLDEQAYQDGNTSTFDYYLGDRRTREEEQEFRQRLAFVKDMFDMLLDEAKAQAVAEYMLGPIKDEGSSDEESEDDQSDVDEDEEEEEEEEDEDEGHSDEDQSEEDQSDEEEEEEESEEDDHHHRRGSHRSSHRHSDKRESHKSSTSAHKRPRDSRYH